MNFKLVVTACLVNLSLDYHSSSNNSRQPENCLKNLALLVAVGRRVSQRSWPSYIELIAGLVGRRGFI